MAEQQQVAEMWDNIYTVEEKQKMRNMLEKHWLPAVSNNILTQYEYSFKKWFEWTIISRKLSQAKEEFNKVLSIATNSKRGDRTVNEKEALKKFIMTKVTCLPIKEMSNSDIDCLCNEIDFYPIVGKSIIFLQGDFGNCYYCIASGKVSLYLEASKDREMAIGREFGALRGCKYENSSETLDSLGKLIITLPTGAGFGEYAILSTSQKLRSCAAVSSEDDSLLLIMHADLYDKVLRRHHYRQRTLSVAIKLLQELPLFKALTYAKISQIAYAMSSQMFSANSTVVTAGSTIKNILLIMSGNITVFPSLKSKANVTQVEKRLPKLAVASLGRGQIIGEAEVLQKLDKFEMTYTSSSNCEVFYMPLNVFVDAIHSPAVRNSEYYNKLEQSCAEKGHSIKKRLDRAYQMMREVMITPEAQCSHYKAELLSILPNIIDDPASQDHVTTSDINNTSNAPTKDNITTVASSYVYLETHPDISLRASVPSPRKAKHQEALRELKL